MQLGVVLMSTFVQSETSAKILSKTNINSSKRTGFCPGSFLAIPLVSFIANTFSASNLKIRVSTGINSAAAIAFQINANGRVIYR